jgi:galactokinase
MTGREEPFRLSLVTTVPPSCVEPYVASVAVAVANAWLSASGRRGEGLPYGRLSLAISHLIRGPYSPAYLMAADAEVTDAAMIVNTLTGERRELPVADDTSVCWSLVDAGTEPWQGAGAYEAFADLAREALLILRNGPYPDLRSLATLDFKELNKALGRLPKRFRPVVRFLVGESHRTQHVETALRREDWHVVGGLLFFSHASFRTEWAATNAEVDYVVSEVEASGGEGMYGACLTGRSGCVLVVGERHATPACLGRMRDGFEERFHRTPRFLLL